MKLSQFLTRIKIAVPNLSGIDDDTITTLLNKACDETNLLCKAYKGYTDFNIVANQATYSLSVIAPTFLGMDSKPLFFKNSNARWDTIIPKTKDWLQKNYPDFLNASSVAIPAWYYQEADELGFYQPPLTSYTSGGRIYHLKKATAMASADSYPFSGSAVEITSLLPLDEPIILWVKHKLSPAVGAVSDQSLTYQEFIRECARASKQIRRRPDISIDYDHQINV
jgi:hypothetical protein